MVVAGLASGLISGEAYHIPSLWRPNCYWSSGSVQHTCLRLPMVFVGDSIAKSEQIQFLVRTQTDLVELWAINCTNHSKTIVDKAEHGPFRVDLLSSGFSRSVMHPVLLPFQIRADYDSSRLSTNRPALSATTNHRRAPASSLFPGTDTSTTDSRSYR